MLLCLVHLNPQCCRFIWFNHPETMVFFQNKSMSQSIQTIPIFPCKNTHHVISKCHLKWSKTHPRNFESYIPRRTSLEQIVVWSNPEVPNSSPFPGPETSELDRAARSRLAPLWPQALLVSLLWVLGGHGGSMGVERWNLVEKTMKDSGLEDLSMNNGG